MRPGAQDDLISIKFGSTTVTNSLSAILSLSGSIMDINEGIWSSYIRRAAAEGIFVDTRVPARRLRPALSL